jgi:hypothetical protein
MDVFIELSATITKILNPSKELGCKHLAEHAVNVSKFYPDDWIDQRHK